MRKAGGTVAVMSAIEIAVRALRMASLTGSHRPAIGQRAWVEQLPPPSTHEVSAIGPSIAKMTSAIEIFFQSARQAVAAMGTTVGSDQAAAGERLQHLGDRWFRNTDRSGDDQRCFDSFCLAQPR